MKLGPKHVFQKIFFYIWSENSSEWPKYSKNWEIISFFTFLGRFWTFIEIIVCIEWCKQLNND